MSNYTFTITLKPTLYRFEPEEQYDRTISHLIVTLKLLSNNFSLVAELTQNMNIHFHGIIELHHKKKWYTTFRQSDIFGFTSCREVTNMQGWVDYISKELAITKTNMARQPILHDDYNIFDVEKRLLYAAHF